MPITSGSIEYERRLNLGEYNHKTVIARVVWTTDPGEDDDVLAAFAVDKAVMRVMEVLRWKPAVPDPNQAIPAEPNPGPDMSDESETGRSIANLVTKIGIQDLETMAAPNLATQHAAAEITAGIPPVLKRHRRTKAEMEAARALEQIKSGMEGAARAAEANPTSQTLTDGSLSSVTETQSKPQNEPGMPSFDPDPTPPAEVTDQALLDACQAKASSGKPVDAIRELVASFSPGGLVQTPQDARRRFLDELAKL